MSTYKTKPVVVEAIQFTGLNWGEIQRFCGFHKATDGHWDISSFNRIGTYSVNYDRSVTGEVWDKLQSTWVGVKNQQWIIKGLRGEFYPCDPEVFENTFEAQ